jgi:hypothetical protein
MQAIGWSTSETVKLSNTAHNRDSRTAQRRNVSTVLVADLMYHAVQHRQQRVCLLRACGAAAADWQRQALMRKHQYAIV